MTKTASTSVARLAKAYASEKLRLDPRAGGAIGDDVWIKLAGKLVDERESDELLVRRASRRY